LNYQLFHKLKPCLLNPFCLFTEPSFPFSLRLEMWSERRSLWFRKQNFRKKKKKKKIVWKVCKTSYLKANWVTTSGLMSLAFQIGPNNFSYKEFENIKNKLKNSVVILQNLLFISYHIKLKNSVAILIAIFVELIFRICCDICWTYFQFISQPLMFLIFYFLKLFKKYKKKYLF
jgi:hypothetical protein